MKLPLLLAALALTACAPPAKAPPPPPPPAAPAAFDRTSPSPTEHGHRLADALGCTDCHGADLTGVDFSTPEYGRLWTANLTRAAPGYSDAELARVIRGGRRPVHEGEADRELWGMPSAVFTHLNDDEMAAVIAWIRTLRAKGEVHPGPTFGPRAKAEIASGLWASAPTEVAKAEKMTLPDLGPEHAQGRYIAAHTCAECHGLNLKGGVPVEGRTPPDLVIATAYSPEQFAILMRTGKPIDGRDMGLMTMVAKGRFSRFTDGEVKALQGYLKALAASGQ
jgi:cytochrome c553